MRVLVRYQRAAFAGIFLFSSFLNAQASNSNPQSLLLLPQPIHVNGQVVGEDGKPIARVRAVHAKLMHEVVTDNDGRIEFNTSAPSFVLQLPGYESAWLQTKDAVGFHVVLHKLPRGASFTTCTAANLAAKIPGWNGIFQIPAVKGVKALAEKSDVDYLARTVQVRSASRTVSLVQGRGTMWGDGNFNDNWFWRAARYHEVVYDFKGPFITIVDAKAEFPDGKCERHLGVFGESMYYYDIDCGVVDPLDKLLDSACLVPNAKAHLLEN
jgi:hypothetical protein